MKESYVYPEGFRYPEKELKSKRAGKSNLENLYQSLILMPVFLDELQPFSQSALCISAACIVLTLRYLLWEKKQELCSFPVTAEMASRWNTMEPTMLCRALQNSLRRLPPRLTNGKDKGTMVLTTAKRLYGSLALFYPGMIEKIASIFDGDFYVDFSNLHELLLFPAKECSALKMRMRTERSSPEPGTEPRHRLYRYLKKKDMFMEV
ncbi:MAG: DUF5688 family protein [Lachnospiraceae bacterium]|jgi:hypothetical protein|nr:DUF5688 family protein [Lachnospiraceae bacterium]